MIVYVQRDGGGNVIGVFANPQPGYAEEALQSTDPAVLAFPPVLLPTADQNELALQTALQGAVPAVGIDWGKAYRAKLISDLAFRLAKAPGALTAAELLAERNRIAAIYKAL